MTTKYFYVHDSIKASLHPWRQEEINILTHLPLESLWEGGHTKPERDQGAPWEHESGMKLPNLSLKGRSTTCSYKGLGASFWISLSSRKNFVNLQDRPGTYLLFFSPASCCTNLELETCGPQVSVSLTYDFLSVSTVGSTGRNRPSIRGWEQRSCSSLLVYQHLWRCLLPFVILAPTVGLLSMVLVQ